MINCGTRTVSWVAVLMSGDVPFCGGSLLTNDLVLTAAHCIRGKDDMYLFHPNNLTVVLGAHNLSDPYENGKIFVNVSKIEVHKDWNITSEDYDADIAILTLDHIVKFNSHITPICLIPPQSNITMIDNGYTAGYGMSEKRSYENILRFINIPIISDVHDCMKSYDVLYKMSSKRTICAGSRNGSGVCEGDSGNGLFVIHDDIHYLRGIVSSSVKSGYSCDTFEFAIFTNVDKFYDWIQEKIKKREQLVLIGSRFITPGTNYTFILYGINLASNSSLSVSFEGINRIEPILLSNLDETLNKEMSFQIPLRSMPNYELKLSYKRSSRTICVEQSIQLINLLERPIILININKPIYEPFDEIKLKVFVLNHKLIPFNEPKKLDVTVTDANNKTFKSFRLLAKNYGLYENVFRLSGNLNFGLWKFEVKVGDKKRSKSFKVQESLKKTIQLDVKMSKELSFYDKQINMSLIVKHPTKIHVTADLTISVDIYSLATNSTIVQNIRFYSRFRNFKKFRLVEDLGISSNHSDCLVKFNITIDDFQSNLTSSLESEVILRKDKIRKISLKMKKYFRPGLTFKAVADVRSIDGKPDNTITSMEAIVTYYRSHNQTYNKSQTLNITNGESLVEINPRNDTTKIEIELRVAETYLREYIERHPGTDEYITVKLTKTNSTAREVLVEASAKFRTLSVIIYGPNGLVYTKNCAEAKGHNNHGFSFNLKDEMKPKATLIAYDFTLNGEIVYDMVELDVGHYKYNSLKISTNVSANSKQLIDLLIESEIGSTVFLTAFEQDSSLQYGLSEKSIYREIMSFTNLKFKSTPEFKFDDSSLFVMQPFKEINNDKTSGIDDEFEESQHESLNAPTYRHDYIPDKWFDDEYFLENDTIKKILKKIPSRQTTWQIQGISIHPTKGLAVASYSLNVDVPKSHLININSPPMTRENEIFEIKYEIKNLVQESTRLSVKVKVENGDLISMNKNSCSISHQPTLSYDLTLLQGTNSIQNIFLRSHKADTMKVTVMTDAKYFVDVERIIKVDDKQKLVCSAFKFVESFKAMKSLKIDQSMHNSRYEVTIYGNLLDPLIGRFESFFPSFKYKESKINLLSASITFYKFLKAINKSEIELGKKIFKDLEKGRDFATELLEAEIELKSPSNIRVVAYAAQALIDCKEFLKIDEELVKAAASLIMSHQNSDGSFPYDEMSSYRVDIGSRSAQVQIQTSIVILLFIKDPELKDIHHEKISKTLNYFNTLKPEDLHNDYEIVLIAHVFSVNDDDEASQFFLKKYKASHVNATLQKHKSMFVETISTLIMTKILLYEDPKEEVKWLIEQRSTDGGFYSPYSTALALQALYEYTKFRNFPQTNLDIYVNNTLKGRLDSCLDSKHIEIDSKKFSFSTTNKVLLYLSEHKENSPQKSNGQFFNVTNDVKNEGNGKYKINIKVRILGTIKIYFKTVNFMMIEVEIPNGYKLDKVFHTSMFKGEFQKNNQMLLIYGRNIKCCEHDVEFSLLLTKIYYVCNLAPSTITVYDYYRQNLKNIFNYTIDQPDILCNCI
ncbi:hypothetical protein ACKWTF_014631 [Chironomus riparius]